MRSRLHLLVFTAAVTLFISCNRNAVTLTDTNAKGEVPPLGNLVFRFSKQLFPDSLLNRWDSVAYVEFEPKIPGRFRWEHGDELIFSPAMPLSPATTYKAKIGSEVLAYSKFGKVSTENDLEFHTPELQLENSNITWVLQDDVKNNAVPQVDLYFNYAITPAVLKDKLEITVDGVKKDYSVQTINNDKKVSLRILQVKATDKDFDAVVKLDKGIVPDGGKNSTKETIEEKFTIPSPYNLTITNVESRHDGLSASVKIFTSQQVVTEGLAPFIKISPTVKYSVETEDDGILITGDAFDVQKTYDLVLTKGLRGKLGGTLKENYNGSIAFGELEPDISFSNKKAVYLSLNGLKNIEVRITNTPKVKVVVSKIYESNLLAAHKYGYYPKTENSYDEYYYEENNGDATLGDVIFEKEIDTRTLAKLGSSRLFNFNISDKIKDFNGIYHLQIQSDKDYWIKDSRFISLSDIGLIAKEGKEKMLVFANSIKTAASLSGVNVTVYGANNQVLGLGTTNTDGVAEIAYTQKDFSGFKPAMIIAKTADDFNYLPFSSTKVNTSRFDVSGKSYSAGAMDAFIYAERDIYRPGEKINANVLLRTADWKSPGELPVKFKFIMPNGKELKNFRKMLNEQGSAELSFDLPQSAITGSYQLELYSGNDVLLTTKTFSVEEFVPDRIKVATQLGKSFLTPGDSTSLRINAVNFFGPPAANRNYECEIQFRQTYFSPAKYDNYTFSLTNHQTFFDKILRDGQTDANGNAEEEVGVPAIYKNMGLLSASIYTTVFDETGRPVSRLTTADVYTQSVFYGLGYDVYYYYPLNQTIQFPLVAVNKDEKPVTAQAKLQVIKHEYRTVLSKSGEYFRYESQKEDVIVKDEIVNVSGDASKYNFVPRQPGDYEVRVYAPGAETYVSRSFYSYGSWGMGDNSSFEVNTEGQIDISINKKEYKTGDKAEILFKTPFSGRMLVTFETDKVVSYQYVNVDKRSASVTLPLTEAHLPNVYVTATLIKPHTVSEIPLTVAHGFQSLKVDAPDRKIDVQITSAKTTRSRTHQKIKVKAAPNSYVTLAAVDNAVLQVSNMATPDPYTYFYQRKELGVEAFDLYPLLFPELRARVSSTGGDGGEMDKRNNPMPNKRIKIVSYWSGVQKTNGNGEVNFEFDVPQFSGEIRLMAVAYKDEKFGSAENNMTVADPVVISAGLPRFLSPGDTVLVPVTLSNTTKNATNAKVHLKVSGPLNVVGIADQQTNLAANAESRAVFKIVAQQRIDSGSVRIEVNALGEKFFDETQITVRPPSTLQKESGSGNITAGSNQAIAIAASRFMPGSADYQLIVSKSPVMEVGDQLNYLVQYPYGCTEQTVSAAFPQLYFSDLADAMKKNKSSSSTAVANINEAIRKIKMRQLYNGSVTLWDDEGTANWWATVYAAHFLLEARKAGYDVDNSLTETMLGYLTTRLKTKETIDYFYNRTFNKKIAPKEVAYSLYVLALANRPQISVMNYYKLNQQMLALDSKYLLAAAYSQSGDKKSFAAMLPSSFAGEVSVAQTGGSFYSDVRDESIALNVLIDVDPGNAQIPLMSKHVSTYLKQRQWLSTQERAFSFLALGKLARTAAKSNVTADVKVNGKVVGKFTGADIKFSAKQLGGTNVELSTSGTGRLYYYWVAEGVSATGSYKEEDSYMKVRRQFYNRFGQVMNGNKFEQNELVIVRVSIDKSFSTPIENVVITDILPAGFEIENPRTKEIPGMDWIKDAGNPTALDVRDDRIHLFVDLNYAAQSYYYAVRAVSPGLYRMGPVSADAMYNGEYHSYNGAGMVEVKAK